jgi:hypothetical protein
MKMLCTLLLLLAGCHSAAPTGEVAGEPPAAESAGPEMSVEPSEGEREPTDEEIREFGLITAIEDGPYPFFSVTVEFPERKMTVSFTVNIENLALDSAQLMALQGQYAKIHYVTKMENMLMDLRYNGKSLEEEGAAESVQTPKKITGVLSGAESVTAGDLPDVISVTDAQGRKLDFEEYITDSVVAVNGKTVTASYYTRGSQIITYLEASKK